jgi:threonine/homoserine/homoserine lactone efflux protein
LGGNSMKLDPLYLLVASAAILTPGPGVLMTVTNAIERGFRDAFQGILGMALGTVGVAAVSASSIGILLTASPAAFAAMKVAGALYLGWLGVKSWRSASSRRDAGTPDERRGTGRRFTQGVALQATNPQAIVFFLALLPQFVDAGRSLLPQYATLAFAFGVLLVMIHSGYAAVAHQARTLIASDRSGRIVRRAGGAAFFLFAGVLVLR